MTYRELYNQTTEWTARHMVKDAMEMNGLDETVSYRDMQRVAEARANDLFPQGCKCSSMDSGGDCDWCQVYYEAVNVRVK